MQKQQSPSPPTSGGQTLLQQEVIREVNNNDVLCGRGAMVDRNEGNVRFRSVIRKFKRQYSSCSQRPIKHKIAMQVYEVIKNRNGRFLRRVVVDPSGESEDRINKNAVSENSGKSSVQSSTAVSGNVQTSNPEPNVTNIWEIVDTEKSLAKIKQALREQYDDSSDEEGKVATNRIESRDTIPLRMDSSFLFPMDAFVSNSLIYRSHNEEMVRRMIMQGTTPSLTLSNELFQLQRQQLLQHAAGGSQQFQADRTVIEHLQHSQTSARSTIEPSILYPSAATVLGRQTEQNDIIIRQQLAQQLEAARLQHQIELQHQLTLLNQQLRNEEILRPSSLSEFASNISRTSAESIRGDYFGIRQLPNTTSNLALLNASPNLTEQAFMRHHSQQELSKLLLSRGEGAGINRHGGSDASNAAASEQKGLSKNKRSSDEDNVEKISKQGTRAKKQRKT